MIKTEIDGVNIYFENIISDKRGAFLDLVENDFDSKCYTDGVKHIYSTVTKTKFVSRGDHFHLKNFENFFTLTGTGLWILVDCRKKSLTQGQLISFITSFEKFENEFVPVYSISDNRFSHFTVPPGVYHVCFSLIDEPLTLLALGSVPFDESDLIKPDQEIKEKVQQYLLKFNLKLF